MRNKPLNEGRASITSENAIEKTRNLSAHGTLSCNPRVSSSLLIQVIKRGTGFIGASATLFAFPRAGSLAGSRRDGLSGPFFGGGY